MAGYYTASQPAMPATTPIRMPHDILRHFYNNKIVMSFTDFPGGLVNDILNNRKHLMFKR